jgi:hypothetical protein
VDNEKGRPCGAPFPFGSYFLGAKNLIPLTSIHG